MKKITIAALFFFCFFFSSYAQMFINRDTLYGNEWIDYQLDYYKLELAEDKLYRIAYEDLLNVGLITANQPLEGKSIQMHYMGEEVPLYTSTEEVFGEEDYIVFYGKKMMEHLIDIFIQIKSTIYILT